MGQLPAGGSFDESPADALEVGQQELATLESVGERTISYKPADGVELITIFRAISSAASIRFSP